MAIDAEAVFPLTKEVASVRQVAGSGDLDLDAVQEPDAAAIGLAFARVEKPSLAAALLQLRQLGRVVKIQLQGVKHQYGVHRGLQVSPECGPALSMSNQHILHVAASQEPQGRKELQPAVEPTRVLAPGVRRVVLADLLVEVNVLTVREAVHRPELRCAANRSHETCVRHCRREVRRAPLPLAEQPVCQGKEVERKLAALGRTYVGVTMGLCAIEVRRGLACGLA